MTEHQNIEYKLTWHDEYLKWICGFANAQGGTIYIGKDDTGKIIGINDSKRLLEDLPNKIQNYLGIVCDIDFHVENNKEFISINVMPYDIAISYHGAYYYRSGSTKQELKGLALQNFLLKKMGKTWDAIVEPNADFTDIDKNAIEFFIDAASKVKRIFGTDKEPELILRNLRLIQDGFLKRAALLLFGKDPRKFFINAVVKIGRFGKSDSDLIYQEVIEGNVFQMTDKVLDILNAKFLVSPISYEGIYRVEKAPYPEKALREVVLNAIVHRDYFGSMVQISVYDNKIIIWNPGILPEGLTIDQLFTKHSSHPRNPLLADVFFKGGLIEAWGKGTIKIIDECRLHGLQHPVFAQVGGGFQVILFADIFTIEYLENMDLNPRQVKAVVYIKEHGEITNTIYQRINNTSKPTATRDLKELEIKNLIINIGTKGTSSIYKIKI